MSINHVPIHPISGAVPSHACAVFGVLFLIALAALVVTVIAGCVVMVVEPEKTDHMISISIAVAAIACVLALAWGVSGILS